MNSKLQLVEPVLFFYSLYFYGSFPLVGQLVKRQIEEKQLAEPFHNVRNYDNVTDVCHKTSVNSLRFYGNYRSKADSEASQILLFMHIAAILPAFLITVLFGGYSDSHGRIPILIMPLFGAAIRLCILIICSIIGLNIFLLILSSLLDGCLGMSSLLFLGCYSYLSDVTTFNERSFRSILLEAAGSVGIILSHLLSGFLIMKVNFLWTLIFLLAIVAITLIYIVFFLKESLNFSDAHVSLHSTNYFKEAVDLFRKNNDHLSAMSLRLTLFLVLLISAAQFGSMDVQTLYLLRYPLCLTSTWIGYFYALTIAICTCANWIFSKFLGSFFGDLGLAALGSVFGISYFLLFAFSKNKLMLFLVPLAGCAIMLPIPILKSYASKKVPVNKLGIMFASISWMQMIGVLLGGVTQNEVFAATISYKPLTVFILDCCVYGCVLLTLCLYFVWSKFRRYGEYQAINSEENC